MSLINEALKRARSEAQRQAEAEREGVAPAPAWTPPPFSRRERSPVLASVAASVGVSALVLGLGYFLLRERPATAPATAVPGPAAPVALAAEPVAPTVSSAAPTEPTAPAPRPGPVAPASRTATRPVAPGASTGAAARIEAGRGGSFAGKTFVREARLPTGATIELGGIISGEIPMAMLNWKMIGIGEFVADCSVVKIEAHRVELRGPDGTFWIELQ